MRAGYHDRSADANPHIGDRPFLIFFLSALDFCLSTCN
jgi:hypothetical protein